MLKQTPTDRPSLVPIAWPSQQRFYQGFRLERSWIPIFPHLSHQGFRPVRPAILILPSINRERLNDWSLVPKDRSVLGLEMTVSNGVSSRRAPSSCDRAKTKRAYYGRPIRKVVRYQP